MFYNCTSLKSISIPDSVTSIGDNVFYNCTSLESAIIGNGVTSLSKGLFSGCSSLVSITLPFVGSSSSATTASRSTLFGYIFGTYYSDSEDEIIHYYDSVYAIKQYYSSEYSTTYYIPLSLTTVTITGGNILYGAFDNCSSLTSIVIGDGVESIGEYAFYECTSLTSITFGENSQLASIGHYAFYGCTSLASITIPDSVTSIDSSVFYDCSNLTSVTFENTSGWYVSRSSSTTSGTNVDVTDASANATYLTNTYRVYYWYRSES